MWFVIICVILFAVVRQSVDCTSTTFLDLSNSTENSFIPAFKLIDTWNETAAVSTIEQHEEARTFGMFEITPAIARVMESVVSWSSMFMWFLFCHACAFLCAFPCRVVCSQSVVCLFLMSQPGMIRSHGYPVEVHQVTTPDGYILQMHRIPNHRKFTVFERKRPVLLVHGFASQSGSWVVIGPNRSLGKRTFCAKSQN